MMRSVELFSGAGGLALGIARSGFEHQAVVEWDDHACETLKENTGRVSEMRNWPIHHCDIRKFDFSSLKEGTDLLAGGVPCQPFSIGGKHRGNQDDRNMFPDLVTAIRILQPKAVLVENVKGLRRPLFAKYFGYIELMLTYPEATRRNDEKWVDHLSRLERFHTSGAERGLTYRVVHRVLNAADYGVPQKRERLFIVAIRADLGVDFAFPDPTHSQEALIWQQFISKEYWEKHNSKRIPSPNGVLQARIDDLSSALLPPQLEPWLTVRDTIQSLPPAARKRSLEEYALTHFAIDGARAYVGHTGSPLDEPAKTLKAGVHGVPGGENMLAKPDGSVRYFTIREAARLQTFPDDYAFTGSWTESMRQIGNAVPVSLAAQIATALRQTLERKQ